MTAAVIWSAIVWPVSWGMLVGFLVANGLRPSWRLIVHLLYGLAGAQTAGMIWLVAMR